MIASDFDDIAADREGAVRVDLSAPDADVRRIVDIAAGLSQARLAMTLSTPKLAALALESMGAGISGMTITNIDKAVLLNGKYGFNGNTYSPKLTTADSNLANCLATQLDNYNNNRPVSSCP